MIKNCYGDLGNGYIVKKDNLFYGIFLSHNLLPSTEKILFVNSFGDKLKESYPNVSIREFDDDRIPKRVKQEILKTKPE